MGTGYRAEPDLSRETIIWLSGLLEGEGSFMRGMPSSPNVPRVSVHMTDEDVIARAARAFGTSYHALQPQRENHKPNYRTILKGWPAVRLMQELRPWMGRRRQEQIDRAVSSWAPRRNIPSPEVEARIAELLRTGRSHRSIAREVGVSHTCVGDRARKLGTVAQ